MMTTIFFVAIVQASALGAEQTGFEQAYHQSVKSGRPLVVLIGAPWCHGCELMRTSIMPQVAKQGGLDRVVFTYIDNDRQRELATRLKRSEAIPQLIRFDQTASGWKKTYLIGAKSPQEVHQFLNVGLSRTKKPPLQTNTSTAKNQTLTAKNQTATAKESTAQTETKTTPDEKKTAAVEPRAARIDQAEAGRVTTPPQGAPSTQAAPIVQTEARARPAGPLLIPAR